MARHRRQPKVLLEITDILETSDRGIRVMIKKTGKPAWLPRSQVEFIPGNALVPVWLARKLKRQGAP